MQKLGKTPMFFYCGDIGLGYTTSMFNAQMKRIRS